ncbi:MAG TPA: lytic transglycosylase domain-containing protein [Streptosporangiaceae bacterium]
MAGRRIPDVRVPGGKGTLVAAAAAVTVLAGGGGALALTGSGGDGGDTATVAPARAAPQVAADAMRRPAEVAGRKVLAERASRAAREDAAKRPVLAVRGTPPAEPKKTDQPSATAAPAGNPVPAGEAQRIAKSLLPKYGFDPDTQFGCLVDLWNRESHWNVHAGSPGGPYGIPQANPGSKMASAGANWLDSASIQINWGLGYIKGRYSGPCDAWSHSQATGWY